MVSLPRWFALFLLTTIEVVSVEWWAKSEISDRDCKVVDTFLFPDPKLQQGDGTCFPGDDLGMICGWDGDLGLEAYCVKDTAGDLVCARSKKGGRCADVPDGKWLTPAQRLARNAREEL